MGGRPRILVLDGDPLIRYLVADVLEELGYAVSGTLNVGLLPHLIREVQPRLLIMDICIGHRQAGWPALQRLRQDGALRELPVLICTADLPFLGSHAPALRALRCHVLEKPFELAELLDGWSHWRATPARRRGARRVGPDCRCVARLCSRRPTETRPIPGNWGGLLHMRCARAYRCTAGPP